jgi:hypothetical protein
VVLSVIRKFLAPTLSLFLLATASAAFGACPSPNPNISAPPFVDGCPLPASGLNNLAAMIATKGTGNVNGPTVTAIAEITSFNNTVGTLLREGAAQISDNQTGAVVTTGATLAGITNPTFSADQILAFTFCTAPCLPLPAAGGGNYDGVRGVGVANPGTTVPIVAGVSGYVLANQPFSGVVPFAVSLFGTGAVNVDGGRVEGINTNISDREFRVAQPPGTHNRLIQNELDLSWSYTDTVATALLISGNAVVQDNNTGGITLSYPNFSGSPGAIKWGQFLATLNGTTPTFSIIGTKAFVPNGGGGLTTNSQDIFWGNYIAGVAFQGQLEFGTNMFGNAMNPAFNFNYPITTMTGGVVARSSTDKIVQIGGNNTLSSGASIESRNDANSLVEPLEILSSNILLNSNMLQVNNGGSGVTTAANCTTINAATVVVINGIMVHC